MQERDKNCFYSTNNSHYLWELRFKACSLVSKPLLPKININCRFDICKRWNFEPNDFGKKVIFTDETSFGLFGSDGKHWVCQPEGS